MTARVEQSQSSAEQQELQALEVVFEQCRTAWIKANAALGRILERKLWKAGGYKSEPEYLQRRWGVSKRDAQHRVQMAKVAASMGDGLPECVRESHIAELSPYPPDMRREILDTAMQTSPGGKLTAGWIEQTGRRLIDARLAAAKEAREEEAARVAAIDDDDEDGDAAAEENEAAADDAPAGTAASGGDRAIQDAARHPVSIADQRAKLEAQARRWVAKGERLALALDCTPQDVLERYGAG